MAALGLPMGEDALVPEHEVRENAVLMVQSDARTRAKGPEHIAAYNWMQDYAAGRRKMLAGYAATASALVAVDFRCPV